MCRDLTGLRGIGAGKVSDVRPDRHSGGAETLLDMIDVVQHHVDIAVAAQKARYATDSDIAAAIGQRADDLIGFAADVPVYRDRAGMAATTGFREILAASRLVCHPECAQSGMTPTRFISAITARPKSLNPAFAGSAQPSPIIFLRLYVRCMMRIPS